MCVNCIKITALKLISCIVDVLKGLSLRESELRVPEVDNQHKSVIVWRVVRLMSERGVEDNRFVRLPFASFPSDRDPAVFRYFQTKVTREDEVPPVRVRFHAYINGMKSKAFCLSILPEFASCFANMTPRTANGISRLLSMAVVFGKSAVFGALHTPNRCNLIVLRSLFFHE